MQPEPRAVVVLAALAVGTAVGAGCGDIEDQSLCAVYEEFLDERAVIEDLDHESLSAEDASGVAEDYLDTVVHLREVDERHSTQIEVLENAVRDLMRTLDSVPDDADYATWAPLVEEDLEAVAHAAVTVDELIEPQCPTSDGEG